MKRIIIDFIPHKDQRYDTCGDWRFAVGHMTPSHVLVQEAGETGEETLFIRVSITPDWRSSALVAVHELIEALLCKHAGVTTEQVDQFDLNWKRRLDDFRTKALQREVWFEEPGDDPLAPYHDQHLLATKFEELMCAYLQYSWEAHSQQVDELE